MAANTGRTDAESGPGNGGEVVRVRTCPGRYVFTERDNTEAWIATDTVVDREA